MALSLLCCFNYLEPCLAKGVGQRDCWWKQTGMQFEIHSPYFVFYLDTTVGLRANTWENRLTNRRICLGDGPELEVELANDDGKPQALELHVSKMPSDNGLGQGKASFDLTANQAEISASVIYQWDAKQPVLRKTVEISNTGHRPVRLLNLHLGTYRTDAKIVGGEQGFPAYLDDAFFMTLAHPSGWVTAQENKVLLCQYPGIKLEPGQKFRSMEVILGVGQAGEARNSFLAHVRSRMRRVVRGHDKPYAIFDPFGARADGVWEETELFVLDNIAKVAQGQRETGCRFDFYSLSFWVDYHGDLKRFDPVRFPNGLEKIRKELNKLGTAPGLWICSSREDWSIGGNPAVKPALSNDGPKGWASLCRAAEPIKSMSIEAFRHHIRENGVRLLKFDGLYSICNNPNHDHLPGLYSTEAIHNAVIDFLHELDQECPDVFLMLYWGHRSPWWLLHADTIFDSGAGIEAANTSDSPAPYARDSITQKLDQAQCRAVDVPPLGKDSLGIWLSDWCWNSSVGKERWPEGFVMDISRGSLLAQPWSDTEWLSTSERKQMAEFISLLKKRPACFGNPRLILGDPRKAEPYGYCCSDGKRAFLALNNCTWKDSFLQLNLNSTWGLPDGQTWDLYRWYPDSARLRGGSDPLGAELAIALRPFEVLLIEVVPTGENPSLNRTFPVKPLPVSFSEASRSLDLTVVQVNSQAEIADASIWRVLRPTILKSAGGATLTVLEDGSILASGENPSLDTYTIIANTDLKGISAIRLEALTDDSLPNHGPGRAANGNFILHDLRVQVASQAGAEPAAPVTLRNAAANFAQQIHQGSRLTYIAWPVTAAIDGDLSTGWSIDPSEGLPHVAVFETDSAVGFANGTTLMFKLRQGDHEHSLGRLRLSITTAKPPIPLPSGYGSRTVTIRGNVPSSCAGGLLVITAQMHRKAVPYSIRNVGSYFSAQGKLAGRTVPWTSILGNATRPSSWQGWRIAIEPSNEPQSFELSIATKLVASLDYTYEAHFLPQ